MAANWEALEPVSYTHLDVYKRQHKGVAYKLYWGDYHRHTDISNCVTANDGCVLEQYRYAWDLSLIHI